jgi:hypothetical protein
MALCLLACQGGGSATSLVALTVTPEQSSIAKGTRQQFTATGSFADGSTQDLTQQVSWRSLEVKLNMGAATIDATGLALGNEVGQSMIAATYMNVTGTTLLTVTPAVPVSMNLTPSNPAIANGTSTQFVAKVTLTDGTTQDVTKTATWTLTSTTGASVGTISAAGLATGTGVGQAAVTATFMQVSATVNLTVTSAVITSLNITPSNPAIAKGTMQQFTATATFTDSTTQDVTQSATWMAVDLAPAANVTTVSATGLALGKSLGSATLTASFAGKSSTARLTVTPAVLASITVSPSAPSIAKGTMQQLTATATFTDATTQDITSTAAWTAADIAPAANVAAVTASGLAIGRNLGSATLTASSGGKSGSATLTVTPAVVIAVSVSPSGPSIAKGTAEQFTATATLSDSTTQDVTGGAAWTASDVTGTGVASIDAAGLATGTGVGTAAIKATYLGLSGSATLAVTAAVVTQVTVSPSAPSIAKGTAQQFTATATLSDKTTQDATSLATWTAVDVTGTGVASIDMTGLATGTGVGTATVRATYLGLSGAVTLTVTAAVVTKLTVAPAFVSIAKGTAQQFTATATLSDTTTQDATNLAVWTTSDVTGTGVASVGMTGLATGSTVGTATITATYRGQSGSAALTVTAAVVTSIAVTPATPAIGMNTAQQFTAIATLSDATTQNVTSLANWSTVDVTGTGVASVDMSGLATGTAVGTATITATYRGVSGSATLTVTSAVVTSVTVTPATPSIAKGVTQQFTAIATLSDATTQDVTRFAVWTTADVTGTGVASIDANGLATGTVVGTATVKATYLGYSGSATLMVTAAVPVSIVITPAPLNIPLNMVVQLTATLIYSDATTLDVTATGVWDSATSTVATVTATGSTGGRARGVSPGTSMISITAKGVTGQLTATVSSCHVTINEVQTAGAGGAADEFVELYNGCPLTVDLNNARLLYRAATGTSDSSLVIFSTPTPIAAGGFLLYVGSQYPAAAPRDGALSAPMAASAGLGVVYPLAYTGGASNLIVDSVGFGATTTNIYVEGTVATAAGSGSSIRRRPDGADSNNNSVDFAVTATPTPRATNG